MSKLNAENKHFMKRLAIFGIQMGDIQNYSMDEVNESARRLAIYCEATLDDRKALKDAKGEILHEKLQRQIARRKAQ